MAKKRTAAKQAEYSANRRRKAAELRSLGLGSRTGYGHARPELGEQSLSELKATAARSGRSFTDVARDTARSIQARLRSRTSSRFDAGHGREVLDTSSNADARNYVEHAALAEYTFSAIIGTRRNGEGAPIGEWPAAEFWEEVQLRDGDVFRTIDELHRLGRARNIGTSPTLIGRRGTHSPVRRAHFTRR